MTSMETLVQPGILSYVFVYCRFIILIIFIIPATFVLLIPCVIIIPIQYLFNQCTILMSLHYRTYILYVLCRSVNTLNIVHWLDKYGICIIPGLTHCQVTLQLTYKPVCLSILPSVEVWMLKLNFDSIKKDLRH